MKTLFTGIAFILLLPLFTEISFGQNSLPNGEYEVLHDGSQYDDNKLSEFLNAVYQGCPQYINESIKDVHKGQLSRFQIVRVANPELIPVFAHLNSLDLKNKCNQELTLDTSIEIEIFNPLKYFFNFYPEQTQFIYSGYQDIYFRIEPIK